MGARAAESLASTPGFEPRVLLLLLLAVLLLLAGLGGIATRTTDLGRTSLTASSPAWALEGGRSSPGAPTYHLKGTALVTPTCTPAYGVRSWLAFDPNDQEFWVAAPPSCVIVLQGAGYGANITASYPVGTNPFGVAIDPKDHEVFVANSGSDNVTVLNDSTGAAIANLPVGSSPSGIAYDPVHDAVFVANNGSNNVSIINASGVQPRVVASLNVGYGPVGVVVDPATNSTFVANYGSNNVSVIATATDRVVGSIPVGTGPYGVALDNRTDRIYVTNEVSSNVSVLDAYPAALVDTIPVVPLSNWGPLDLQGIAYDSGRNLLWVAGGYSFAIVLNASLDSVSGFLTIDPSGVAYDPNSGNVCMTNTANRTLLCLSSPNFAFPTVPVTFHETGLALGASWSVGFPDFNAQVGQQSNASDLHFWLGVLFSGNTYSYVVAAPGGQTPNPSTGNLTISYSSTALVINVTFGPGPPTYLVAFTETGLPAGSAWSVSIGASTFVSTSATLGFREPNGTYNYSVSSALNYSTSLPHGQFAVLGAGVALNVTFSSGPPPPFWFVTFTETGLPASTGWNVTLNGTPYRSYFSQFGVQLPAGTYPFLVAPVPPFLPSPEVGQVFLLTGNVTISITFVAYYPVDFEETGLPVGDLWTVALDQNSVSSTTPWINFSRLVGNHSFSVPPLAEFSADPSAGNLTVSGPVVESIVFTSLFPPAPSRYAVQFTEVGLPLGTGWQVAVNGSLLGANGSTLAARLANGTYGFTVLAVSGYVSTPATAAFTVVGGPVNVTVQFSTVTPGGGGSPANGAVALSVLYATVGIALLAGAAVGLVVGVSLAKARRPPMAPPT